MHSNTKFGQREGGVSYNDVKTKRFQNAVPVCVLQKFLKLRLVSNPHIYFFVNVFLNSTKLPKELLSTPVLYFVLYSGDEYILGFLCIYFKTYLLQVKQTLW
jgi:hypothetical protein